VKTSSTNFRLSSKQQSLIDGFKLTTLELSSPTISKEFDGFTLVQLTDFHFGPITPREHLERAISISNECKPDIYVLTGDFLQLHSTNLYSFLSTEISPKMFKRKKHRRKVLSFAKELAEIFSSLQAPDGIFAILGNHDYLEGKDTILRQLPLRWLNNKSAKIIRGDSSISISGIDDHKCGVPELGKVTKEILENSSELRLLLAHNPDVVISDDKENLRHYDLTLCGHTHGGQICLPGGFPLTTQTKQRKFVKGLHDALGTKLYISSGTGFGGIRLRLFCPPEIVCIRLRKNT